MPNKRLNIPTDKHLWGRVNKDAARRGMTLQQWLENAILISSTRCLSKKTLQKVTDTAYKEIRRTDDETE